jgi:hypothetical protein
MSKQSHNTLAALLRKDHGFAPEVADDMAVVVEHAATNWDRWRFVIRMLPVDDVDACAVEASRLLQAAGYTVPDLTVMA